MKLEVAKAIEKAGQDLGFEMSVYENYSGRGMYGSATTGIVYDNLSDLLQATAQAMADILDESEGSNESLDDESFIVELGQIRQDQMGRSGIVY